MNRLKRINIYLQLSCMFVMIVRLWSTRHHVRSKVFGYQANTVRKLVIDATQRKERRKVYSEKANVYSELKTNRIQKYSFKSTHYLTSLYKWKSSPLKRTKALSINNILWLSIKLSPWHINYHHYKFIAFSKLQAFLLKQNLCFTENHHILQNTKLKIIRLIRNKGWGKPM